MSVSTLVTGDRTPFIYRVKLQVDLQTLYLTSARHPGSVDL